MTPSENSTAAKLVPSVLREYGEAARAVLFRYLPEREPRRYLYEPVSDYLRRGGRAFRPSLCIATARAFGGAMEDVLGCAAAIEMLHNALLIHDDIEDESDLRRGRPALHVLHGVPIALNAGDTLTLLSLRPLIDNCHRLGPRLTLRVLEETERMALESAEGQALELGWRRDNVVQLGESDYLAMVLKKTCWLGMIHPCRIGALVGTGDRIDLEPLVRFGFFLGAAFQIQDDLLNLVGDEAAYGKELGGDLYEGKRTLMLIRLLEQATADERRRIVTLLSRPRAERAEAEVRWMWTRMDSYGCIEYAREVAHGLAGAALHELSIICRWLPESRDRSFLEALPAWVIERA